MAAKTIPEVTQIFCDVCGSECTESRHETTVIISRFEYCYMGNRQGKYKKTYDLCDTCGDKLDALIAPKAK